MSINQLDITRWTKIPGARKQLFLGTLKNLLARKQQQANEFCRWRFTLKFWYLIGFFSIFLHFILLFINLSVDCDVLGSNVPFPLLVKFCISTRVRISRTKEGTVTIFSQWQWLIAGLWPWEILSSKYETSMFPSKIVKKIPIYHIYGRARHSQTWDETISIFSQQQISIRWP